MRNGVLEQAELNPPARPWLALYRHWSRKKRKKRTKKPNPKSQKTRISGVQNCLYF